MILFLLGSLWSYYVYIQSVSSNFPEKPLLDIPAHSLEKIISAETIHKLSLQNSWRHKSAGSTEEQVKDAIRSIAFFPEEQVIISGSADGVAHKWSIVDGKLKHFFEGNLGSIDSVALSPDGTLLATGTSRLLSAGLWDDSVQIWSSTDKTPAYTLGGPRDVIAGCSIYRNSVVFSPDGSLLAASGYDHTVRVWQVADGTPLFTLEGHLLSVLNVAFSPDGNLLASASADETVKVWDIYSGNLLYTLPNHLGGVTTVAFSPDGNTLISGGTTGEIKLWHTANGELIRTFDNRKNVVSNLAFVPNGDLVAAGSPDYAVHFWTVKDGKLVYKLENQTARINSVTFSQNGKLLATGAEDGMIQLWHIAE